MANAVLGNKVYIDSSGSIPNLPQRPKVAYILFTPNASNDSVTLGETSSGPAIIFLQGATAKTTMIFRMPEVPLVFNNGIYVQSLSTGAKVTLITTTAAGS